MIACPGCKLTFVASRKLSPKQRKLAAIRAKNYRQRKALKEKP